MHPSFYNSNEHAETENQAPQDIDDNLLVSTMSKMNAQKQRGGVSLGKS